MIQLPNGCYCSNLSVHPKNWKSANADVESDWYISYRFYDPNVQDKKGIIKPKLMQVKGMNSYKTLSERRRVTTSIIKFELEQLVDRGYNPITSEYANKAADPEKEISINEALQLAFDKITVERTTRADIKSVLKYFKISAANKGFSELPVTKISRRHIIQILEDCKEHNPKWSENLFNHYRKYLWILYSYLVEVEIVETNPIKDISKKKTIKRIRQTIDDQDRQPLDEYLKDNYPELRRFVHIFYHSGARISELVNVRMFHVDLIKQRYKVTIKKGKEFREVWKVIKDIALPFWQEITSEANPGDYIFSRGLKPGIDKIPPKAITKRWRLHVKHKIGIEADLYSLKHLNTTDMRAFLDAEEVARLNSHTSTAMVVNIYDVENRNRENEKLKSASNSFTGVLTSAGS